MISMIWAMDRNRLIGKNNAMPWRLPGESAYFRKTTMGHPILMGRKTFESLGSKPLKGRENIVLTRDSSYEAEGCTIIRSFEEALIRGRGEEEFFVIGGSEVYTRFLPYADRLYVTRIDHEFEGDAYFPVYNEAEWRLVSQENGVTDERNPYAYTFYIYDRIR
jgi:dihydrofolate reductase